LTSSQNENRGLKGAGYTESNEILLSDSPSGVRGAPIHPYEAQKKTGNRLCRLVWELGQTCEAAGDGNIKQHKNK